MNVFDDAWGDGGPLWTWHRFDDAVDFFDGEEPGGRT
jgi:hypothetical protein